MMLDDAWCRLMMPDDAWWRLMTLDDAWWHLMSRAILSLPWNCGKMERRRIVYLVKYLHPLHFINNFMAVVTSICPTLCWLSKLELSASKPVLNWNHGVLYSPHICLKHSRSCMFDHWVWLLLGLDTIHVISIYILILKYLSTSGTRQWEFYMAPWLWPSLQLSQISILPQWYWQNSKKSSEIRKILSLSDSVF